VKQAISRLHKFVFIEFVMWISTEKTMPEEMHEVLIFDAEKGVVIGHYFGLADSLIRTFDGARLTHAKYWMFIPELPEKGLKII
jgi:hypothetical protein